MSQTQTTTQTQETLTIDQAALQVAATFFLRAKLRLKEPGTYGQEVSLSFSHGKDPSTGKANWYEIFYTIPTFRLDALLPEAEALNGEWATFGLGPIKPSAKSPTRYGNVRTLLFPSELLGASAPTVQLTQAAEEEEDDDDHPF